MNKCLFCKNEIENNPFKIYCNDCEDKIKTTPYIEEYLRIKKCFRQNTFNVSIVQGLKVETTRKQRSEILEFINEMDIMEVEVRREDREEVVIIIKKDTVWIVSTATVDFRR